MSQKSPRPRRLLFIKTYCHGNRDTVVAYYVTAKQLALTWDGLSPLRTAVGKLTAAALREIARRGGTPVGVKRMTLSTQRVDGQTYFYWEVQHGRAGDVDSSSADEVLLDLRGGVIEQQVKQFTEANHRKRSAASEAYREALPTVL